MSSRSSLACVTELSRRHAVGAALAIALVRPARAQPGRLAAVIRAHTGGASITQGRVAIDISPLVENGNAVPVTVTVDAPMDETRFVRAIALFNERNPQADVFVARLGPRAGRAVVSTRIRLATSQKLVALAEMSDGSWWSDEANVVVTLAACVEG
jgi:sulfur-oxidizing protein SoxY